MEIWNGAEYEALNRERFLLRLRGEIRTTRTFRQFLTARGIADMKSPVAKHFTVIGQLQTVASHPGSRGWEDYNRGTVGAEFPFEREGYTLTARAAGEHFWYGGRTDYRRHRERVLLRISRLPLQPQGGLETIWDAKGWATTRIQGSVLVPFSPLMNLDAGYYYEWRPERVGGNRHVIYTFFRFRKPKG